MRQAVPATTQSTHQHGIASAPGLRARGGLFPETQTASHREISTMVFRLWITSRSKRPVRPPRRRTRLELELLEDRLVLSGYQQLNLVGFQPGMARHTDPNLNGWGFDHTPDGPYCVANTATGVATFYDAAGHVLPLVVTIPAAPSQPFGPIGSPTGVVYNPTSDFVISANGKSAPATFLFDTLDGLVCGWNPAVDPTHAVIMVDRSTESPFPASYDGLALGQNSHGQNVLYAADSGVSVTDSNNRIDMFDGGFASLGSFTDPNVASQYPGNVAFQVENEDGRLFVTFGGFTAPFGGVVDVFDTDGHLLTPNHFAANAPGAGPLDNPWGITLAPSNFGPFSNDLLIGNVEDAGNINAFDPVTGAFLGSLRHPDGTPIAIAGLWDLTFGGGGRENGDPNRLYFTAGPNAVDFAGNGLFGVIFAAGKGAGAQQEAPRGGAAIAAQGPASLRPASSPGPQSTGSGLFIVVPPADLSAFTTSGNQGQGKPIDRFTAPEGERSHRLDFELAAAGVLENTPERRRQPVHSVPSTAADPAVLDQVFATEPTLSDQPPWLEGVLPGLGRTHTRGAVGRKR
jgi:uncharacterized protein (TIGR03118 family)